MVPSTTPKTPFFSLCRQKRIRNVKIEILKSTRLNSTTSISNCLCTSSKVSTLKMAYSSNVMEEIAGEDWMYMNWDEDIMYIEAQDAAKAALVALKAAKRAKKVARRAKKKCRKARKAKKELVANSELNANSEPWYPKN